VSKIPHDLIPLCHFFEKAYVGSMASKPLFDPSFWSINCKVRKRIPRTSNFCEGWYNRFMRCIKYSKPPLPRFLVGILVEQNRTKNRLEKYELDGKLTLQRKKYRAIHNRIRGIVKDYRKFFNKETFLVWLKSLTYFVAEDV
jgi:hypothetical protein